MNQQINNEKQLEPWIETFTGKQFEFLDPRLDTIDIRDIAHSLAFTCRYTGHSKRFYSVAEHSIFVSYLANDPLAGLLHDASEAYITDIASPVKPYLSNYKELEDMLMGRIATKFGFPYPLDPDIKDCDATQLKTEAKYLLASRGEPWTQKYPTKRAHGIKPQCMSPEAAEVAFLERFNEVRNEPTITNWSAWPYDVAMDILGDVGRNKYIHSVQDISTNEGALRNFGVEEQSCDCYPNQGNCGVGLKDVAESLSQPEDSTRGRS